MRTVASAQVASPTPSASATPSPSPVAVVAPVTPRISIAAVVKQIAPKAKTALLIARGDDVAAELVTDLAASGIAAERSLHNKLGCMPEAPPHIDVIVIDDPSTSMCGEKIGRSSVIAISRSKRAVNPKDDDRVLIDERCVEPVCDVFVVKSAASGGWLLRGDLPLTFVHENLTEPKPTRTARGVLVDGALDLGGTTLAGTTLVRVEGASALSTPSKVRREELEGWWPYEAIEALPRQVRGIAEVRGAVRLDGSVGLGHLHVSDWKRATDTPPELALATTPATVGTMTAEKVEFVMDAPTLARLNAKTNAALMQASVAIAKGDLVRASAPLEEALAAIRAVIGEGHDFGRAQFLDASVAGLAEARRETGAKRALALARAFNVMAMQLRYTQTRVFFDAWFVRTCDELKPVAEGSDANDARAVHEIAWRMYENRSLYHPLLKSLLQRFGPPPERAK